MKDYLQRTRAFTEPGPQVFTRLYTHVYMPMWMYADYIFPYMRFVCVYVYILAVTYTDSEIIYIQKTSDSHYTWARAERDFDFSLCCFVTVFRQFPAGSRGYLLKSPLEVGNLTSRKCT